MKNFDFIQDNEILIQQSIKFFSESLSKNPNNASLKMKLGNSFRKAGKLKEALEIYQQMEPKDVEYEEANRLSQILSQNDLSSNIKEKHAIAAPFYQIYDFLSPGDVKKIFDIIQENEQVFRQSTISIKKEKGLLNEKIRASKLLQKESFPNFSKWFLDKIEYIVPKIASKLEQTPPRISKETEIQLTMHLDGDFFKTHRDSRPDMPEISSRQITFVYYFHRIPKGFEGGNLLLFDTSKDGKSFDHTAYTKIEPDHNKIIFFPSHCYHKVTPIRLISNDYRDGRFTLNGWVHE